MSAPGFSDVEPIRSDAEVELEFYEKFFIERGLDPYPVQEQAVGKIFAGESLLVAVPTGTGKTVIAKAGILRALRAGKTAIYTTPLRALTEEKYRELSDDFGPENVGFATGDYKVNPEAPIQVLVAEILWNRIYGDRVNHPADIVIMDEGHYFNDFERGYVWEQSIIGLHPRSQLIILSATVGFPDQFCQWVYVTRRIPMALVVSYDRKVPLYHEFRDQYLIETVKELYQAGDHPAVIFSFGRELCFERARILRSCPRFTTDAEKVEIETRAKAVLLEGGLGPELFKLLGHGIGIHHAGILPSYRRLVEELTLDRLLKFVVTTETIAAGINLPAKRVIFPSLRKHVRGKARILFPAEYHQMAGRAGRPQFDKEGIAITLGPEEVIQEIRKEIKDQKKAGFGVDEEKIKKKHYARAKAEAAAKKDVSWDSETHKKLVEGQPAPLKSRTQITAEQILAIGLPDLAEEKLPGQELLASEAPPPEPEVVEAPVVEAPVEAPAPAAPVSAFAAALASAVGATVPAAAPVPAPKATPVAPGAPAKRQRRAAGGARDLVRPFVELTSEPPPAPTLDETKMPAYEKLDIKTVIDNLLLSDGEKRDAHKRLAQITANLQALGVLDEHGRQVKGEIIGKVRGIDGTFLFYALMTRELLPEELRELVEFLVDHDVIHKIMSKKGDEEIRQKILAIFREKRRENPLVTWEDAEEEYFAANPRELGPIELLHQSFLAQIPHQELHGGKTVKKIWAEIEDEGLTFLQFVEKHDLAHEEGSLFTYLARVMKTAKMLGEVTGVGYFVELEGKIRQKLAAIDLRVLEGVW